MIVVIVRWPSRKLEISTEPTKAKSREKSLFTDAYPKQSRWAAGQIPIADRPSDNSPSPSQQHPP